MENKGKSVFTSKTVRSSGSDVTATVCEWNNLWHKCTCFKTAGNEGGGGAKVYLGQSGCWTARLPFRQSSTASAKSLYASKELLRQRIRKRRSWRNALSTSSRGEIPSQGRFGNLCIEGSSVTIARTDSSMYPNNSCTDQICPSVESKISENSER